MSELKFDSIISKKRFEALSDAVFAITMTLMILDLKVPENMSAGTSSADLSTALLNLLISAESYIVSFIILGIFWVRQQIQFNFVQSVDMRVLVINIFFLLIIGFVPFSVSLIRKYPTYEIPFLIYISNLILISLVLFLHWVYASRRHNIISNEVSPEVKKKFMLLSVVPVLIFISSLLASFISVRAALYIVYLDPLFYIFFKKFTKSSSAQGNSQG